MPVMTELSKIEKALGSKASYYLEHQSKGIPKEHLHLPGGDFVDRVSTLTDRNPRVLRNLQSLFDHGDRNVDVGVSELLDGQCIEENDVGIDYDLAIDAFAPRNGH